MDLNFAFDHLQIDDATAVFPLPWLSPKAKLICRPAVEANRPFYEALLRTSGARQRASLTTVTTLKVDPENSRQDRREDRNIYPGLVVVGWEGITNRQGQEVEFSVDACGSFLRALPDWIFDRLRLFAMRPDNFVREAAPLPDAATLVGN